PRSRRAASLPETERAGRRGALGERAPLLGRQAAGCGGDASRPFAAIAAGEWAVQGLRGFARCYTWEGTSAGWAGEGGDIAGYGERDAHRRLRSGAALLPLAVRVAADPGISGAAGGARDLAEPGVNRPGAAGVPPPGGAALT